MALSAQDVINYFLQHPPFEITDVAKYTDMLNFIAQLTMNEMSENTPILEEKEFTSPPPANPNDEYVLVNVYDTIDENFMEFIILREKDLIVDELRTLFYSHYGYSNPSVPLSYAYQSGSLKGALAVKESLYIVKEYFDTHVSKYFLSGTNIKLKPNIKYVALYNRYFTLDEIPINMITIFKELFEINMMLHIYQSDTFSSEGGIRSVSLSGLSVSFNVPATESITRSLQRRKDRIISSIAIDYDGDGLGLI